MAKATTTAPHKFKSLRARRRRAIKAACRSLIPKFVDHGFVRDDLAESYEREGHGTWLRGALPPAVGQKVKAQLVFRRPMKNGVRGEPATTWCLMGGTVVEVAGDATVIVEFSPSSDNPPLQAEEDWCAIFALDFDWDFPWVLLSMTMVPRTRPVRSTGLMKTKARAADCGSR